MVGSMTNTVNGTVTVTDEVHADGQLCNYGTITGPKLKIHGGTICGSGTIAVDEIEFDDQGARAGSIIGTITITNQTGSCNGSGSTSTSPLYYSKDGNNNCDKVGDTCSFNDLLNLGSNFNVAGTVTSCGESTASALPVDLLYFNGTSNSGSVELNWSTATEINNDHFEIESSIDGISFTKIGEIKGNGTTNDVMKYSFVDDNPLGFENYYRLKQVDYDGQFEVFNTIMVLSTGSSNIKIYPNPTSANSKLVVQVNNSLEPDLVSVELSDLSGRILQKRLGYDHSFEFSTAHLTKGTYLVRVSMNRIVRTSKVLVD